MAANFNDQSNNFAEKLQLEFMEEVQRRNKQIHEENEGNKEALLERESSSGQLEIGMRVPEQSHLKIFELEPDFDEPNFDYQRRMFPDNRKYAKAKPRLGTESEQILGELKKILSLKNENVKSETITIHAAEKSRKIKLGELMAGVSDEKKKFMDNSKGSLLSELALMNKKQISSIEESVLGD